MQRCPFRGGVQYATAIALRHPSLRALTRRTKPHARLRQYLFLREPDWHFSLILCLQILFLFIAVPAFSSDRRYFGAMAMLQLILATVYIALLAKSRWLRANLALSFGAIFLTGLMPGHLSHLVNLSVALAYNIVVTVALLGAVFGPGDVNHHRIAGAVSIYLNIASIFALAFLIIASTGSDVLDAMPTERQTIATFIHLSLATLTAIGDTAALPQSSCTRSLSDLETVIGQLYPAILLSRLVGLHVSKSSG